MREASSVSGVGTERFPWAVREAWEDSFLARLPDPAARLLLDDARLTRLAAGEIFYRGAHHEETVTLALVVDGLLRSYVNGRDRQVTVRYASSGAVVGLEEMLLGGTGELGRRSSERWRMLGGAAHDGEALRDSLVLKIRPARLRAAMEHDVAVTREVTVHLATRLAETHRSLAADLFLPVSGRVAHHLLNLAEWDGCAMVVRKSHHHIAGAVGSVREVVSRALKRMEHDGLVDRVGGPAGPLRLVDPAALHRLAAGGAGDELAA